MKIECPNCGCENIGHDEMSYVCLNCAYRWDHVENEKSGKDPKKGLKNTSLFVGGSVGIGVASNEVVKEVKSLELNLLRTTTDDGFPTGHGNMFENCILREYPGAVKVNNSGNSSNKLYREKNGVDVRLPDGTDVQCKCCATPEGAVKSLMKDGKFRYDGQTVMVPKGQGSRVKQLLRKEGVDAPVIESDKYTYEQVKNLTSRGWGSARFDAANPTIIGGALFMSVVVGTCVYLYEVVNNPHKPWWKKALTAGGFAAGAFLLVEALVVGLGQLKRL